MAILRQKFQRAPSLPREKQGLIKITRPIRLLMLLRRLSLPQATTKIINSTIEQKAAAKCFQNHEKLFLNEVKVI